jgi:threonyl-tRNA synthetase
MLILGEKEVQEEKISLRKQGEGDQGSMSIVEFVEYFNSLL